MKIIGDENRITDVLIKPDYISRKNMGYDGFAVECQCVHTAFDEYLERNQAYRNHKLLPLWIFGERYYNFKRVKKIVSHNIERNGFAAFFINDKFHIFNGKKNFETDLKDIILTASGFYEKQKSLFELETSRKELLEKCNQLEEIITQERAKLRELGIKFSDLERENSELKTQIEGTRLEADNERRRYRELLLRVQKEKENLMLKNVVYALPGKV